VISALHCVALVDWNPSLVGGNRPRTRGNAPQRFLRTANSRSHVTSRAWTSVRGHQGVGPASDVEPANSRWQPANSRWQPANSRWQPANSSWLRWRSNTAHCVANSICTLHLWYCNLIHKIHLKRFQSARRQLLAETAWDSTSGDIDCCTQHIHGIPLHRPSSCFCFAPSYHNRQRLPTTQTQPTNK